MHIARIGVAAAVCWLTGDAIAGEGGAWIRVNQIGYLPEDPKIAVLSSDEPLAGEFRVGSFGGRLAEDQGAWGPFAHNYRLDFSALEAPGEYRVVFTPDPPAGAAAAGAGGTTVESEPFAIGAAAYDAVPEALLSFMRLQRCGENPVTGKLCHQHDGIDTVSGEQIDLRGGWHDAADHLKHMITTTYCVAALDLAGADEEAAWGTDLVARIYRPDAGEAGAGGIIYVQVADDRDHGLPHALWHEDSTDYGWGPGSLRPAWRATGAPDGPKYQNESTGLANLAGRAAAAMALRGDIETARGMYALAKAHPGCAMSVPVKAPYYYGESSYHDDLEWAATELYIATGEKQFLEEAMAAAEQAGASEWMGLERHGHYEFFPYVNLAHWRLYPHVDKQTKAKLAGYYRAGLEKVRERAEENPYRLGTPLVWCSTNNVVAVATQAALYEQMTGDTTYRTLGAEARDWIFGRNPWGVSMVIGVPGPGKGAAASQPHHLFWLLEKRLPVGGLVDGPVYKDINDGLKFQDFGEDAYARFQSVEGGVYHDVFGDFSTNEPIIDGTVSLLLLLEVWDDQRR